MQLLFRSGDSKTEEILAFLMIWDLALEIGQENHKISVVDYAVSVEVCLEIILSTKESA